MERGPFIRAIDVIVDCYRDKVSPVGLDCRCRKLAVDEKDVLFVTIWCYGASCDCEVIESLLT